MEETRVDAVTLQLANVNFILPDAIEGITRFVVETFNRAGHLTPPSWAVPAVANAVRRSRSAAELPSNRTWQRLPEPAWLATSRPYSSKGSPDFWAARRSAREFSRRVR